MLMFNLDYKFAIMFVIMGKKDIKMNILSMFSELTVTIKK